MTNPITIKEVGFDKRGLNILIDGIFCPNCNSPQICLIQKNNDQESDNSFEVYCQNCLDKFTARLKITLKPVKI
jgi:hypothetical protein